jgi:hypothetical protein
MILKAMPGAHVVDFLVDLAVGLIVRQPIVGLGSE